MLDEQPYRERLWELLVLARYRCGRQAEALEAYQQARAALLEGVGLEPGPALRDLHRQVLAQDPGLPGARVFVPAPRTAGGACPYKGLARYDETDAAVFVGRERLVETLLARLVDRELSCWPVRPAPASHLCCGPGCYLGLAAGALPGSAGWRVETVVPGTDPVGGLQTALRSPCDLLVVDQAEELLLASATDSGLGPGDGVATAGDLLVAALDAGTRVVLALRADFYGRLADHQGLARRAGPATVLVSPPTSPSCVGSSASRRSERGCTSSRP